MAPTYTTAPHEVLTKTWSPELSFLGKTSVLLSILERPAANYLFILLDSAYFGRSVTVKSHAMLCLTTVWGKERRDSSAPDISAEILYS